MSSLNDTSLHDSSEPFTDPPFYGGLLEDELPWRKRYNYLLSKGYMLRPRYKPDWTPSWIGTSKHPMHCEDGIPSENGGLVLDAIKLDKDCRVAVKEVSRNSNEATISSMMSSRENSRNHHNHCVEVFDILEDCVFPDKMLLVMLFLHPCNEPTFKLVEEVMDFVKQTLEGLCFLHSHGVAHRDCWSTNIMMDARPLYPYDYHPIRTDVTPDFSRDSLCENRHGRNVKYYYIDFGISSYFKDGESPFVHGRKWAGKRTRKPPEFSLPDGIPYNAFMLDIFMLGRMYEDELVKKYRELGFLEPLVSSMTDEQPERRPTAEVALNMLHDIQRQFQCTGSILQKDATPAEVVLHKTMAAANFTFNITRSFMGF